MTILLTNDDGYQSEGINTLYRHLTAIHQVYILAPLKQMSATGHAITLFKPMLLKKIQDNIHALDGTPADCIKVALFDTYKDIHFDMVISGINEGPNMGDDIFYSGTVAGAREGLMNEIFSVACSQDGWVGQRDLESPARYIANFIGNLDGFINEKKFFLNINFPRHAPYRGTKITHLGSRVYRDFIEKTESNGEHYVTVGGDDPAFSSIDGSDMDAVHEGYVSITPIVNELTDSSQFESLKFLENR